MTDDDLVRAMRGMAPEDVSPATADEIAAAEAQLGFPLFPLHRRLLMEIQNGGFGPAYGIIGTDAGFIDDDSGSIGSGTRVLELAPPLTVLCNWGCGTWSCLDSHDGRIVTLDEIGLTDNELGLNEFLQDWLAGVDLQTRMYEREIVPGINPFTGKPASLTRNVRALGKPHEPRR